jgi:hypothetical protein
MSKMLWGRFGAPFVEATRKNPRDGYLSFTEFL